MFDPVGPCDWSERSFRGCAEQDAATRGIIISSVWRLFTITMKFISYGESSVGIPKRFDPSIPHMGGEINTCLWVVVFRAGFRWRVSQS